MINLTSLRYCIGFDSGIEIGNNSDGKIQTMLGRYILDFKYEKKEDKSEFIVKTVDYEYSVGKIYLWHKILIDYVLAKGYGKVIFLTDYPNLDLVEVRKEFGASIGYPEDNLLAGEYCKDCIKRKNCSELHDTYFMEHEYGKAENDSMLFNTYILINSRCKTLLETAKGIKEILYAKIDKAGNCLALPEMNIQLSKKQIDKDTIDFDEAKELGLLTPETTTIKITAVKEAMEKDGVLKAKVHFIKVPFKTELQIDNIKP